MDGTVRGLLGDAFQQMINLGIALLQAIAVISISVVVAGSLRRLVRRKLAHALLP
jgi:hypothetical protein